VLQGHYKGVTWVSEGCYKRPRRSTFRICKGVVTVLHGCYGGVTRVLQGFYRGATKVLQGCADQCLRSWVY
jgi:hypothetical protein